jgi:hypothetical protein
MDEVLLAKLGKTESVTLPTAIVRAPEDAELTSGASGFLISVTCSGGRPDDCVD